MSDCAHMNPGDVCASCWREKWNATLDREARWIEKLKQAEAESEQRRVALLLDAAAFARLRECWPHIEIPTRKHNRDRSTRDPGAPTCLRCKIEDLLAAAQPKEEK